MGKDDTVLTREEVKKKQLNGKTFNIDDFKVTPILYHNQDNKWCKFNEWLVGKSPNLYGYIIEVPEIINGMEINLTGYIVRAKMKKEAVEGKTKKQTKLLLQYIPANLYRSSNQVYMITYLPRPVIKKRRKSKKAKNQKNDSKKTTEKGFSWVMNVIR